eukprot:scaffold192220_cov28-Tisochrysis_lutea.AAC.3
MRTAVLSPAKLRANGRGGVVGRGWLEREGSVGGGGERGSAPRRAVPKVEGRLSRERHGEWHGRRRRRWEGRAGEPPERGWRREERPLTAKGRHDARGAAKRSPCRKPRRGRRRALNR